MSSGDDDAIGCTIAGAFVFFAVVTFFGTMPSSDQVCRNREIPLFDWLHGISWQPTCQVMLDRLDDRISRQAVQIERLQSDLEETRRRIRAE